MKKHEGRCRFTQSGILEIHTPYPMAVRKGDPNVNFVNKGYKLKMLMYMIRYCLYLALIKFKIHD